MLKYVDPSNILFLDIETVRGKKTYDDLSEAMQYCWDIKSDQLQRGVESPLSPAATYEDRAGIYCEFGKIVCISVGLFRRDADGSYSMRIKSFYGHDEKELLQDFAKLLDQYYNDDRKHGLCGHNIKEFDIPYICRRMVINGMELPKLLDIGGKKPWETKHLYDTLELWSFGDRKAPTSLKLLCAVFDIPTPKDDIDGSQVGSVYWDDNDIDRIETYCKKDVLACARLFLKYQLQPLLSEDKVTML